MFIRFKEADRFSPISHNALMRFLKGNTSESGILKNPFEAVLTGILNTESANDEQWIPWIFSTFDNDRANERISLDGWELDRYQENPVVLWAHCHWIPAIGIARNVAARDRLAGENRFNDRDFDEFGWSIGERVKAGVIRAGSVGIIVKEIEWVDHKKNPEEECDLIIRRKELLEFSVCNVPMNPFALRTDSPEPQRTGAPTARSSGSGHWPLLTTNTNGGTNGRRDASRA